jgi:SAM-dependent methyltransferase
MPERERIAERMDDPGLCPREHHRALAGLDRINSWTRLAARLWPLIAAEANAVAPRTLTVLDVATGSGGNLVDLARLAQRTSKSVDFSGCDLSPTAVGIAGNSQVFLHNAVTTPLPGAYDVVMTSLFLHHLSEEDAVTVLRRMKEAAARMVIVCDLARSRLNRLMVSLACHALSRSPIVHFDGPASVRSAFTLAEARRLAAAAGMESATVTSLFPCRWLMTWKRS